MPSLLSSKSWTDPEYGQSDDSFVDQVTAWCEPALMLIVHSGTMRVSKPAFFRRLSLLGCGQLQVAPDRQQRPPQLPLMHSAFAEQRAFSGFLPQLLAIQKKPLWQSSSVVQVILHIFIVVSHLKLAHGCAAPATQEPEPLQVEASVAVWPSAEQTAAVQTVL